MENKILHTILNIIKLSKTKGTSYYKIKRNIVKLKFEINLNDYLNYLLKINCIEKKKNKYFYLQNKINHNLELLIDEEESDSEIDPIVLKKNNDLNEENIELDFDNDSSDSDDEIPYFIFSNDQEDNFTNDDVNLNNLEFLLNILGNQLEFDDNDIKLLDKDNKNNYSPVEDDDDEESDDEESDDDDEESDDDDEESDDDNEESDDDEKLENKLSKKNKNRTVRLRFKTKMEDITLLNDGIVENKKKPDNEEFEFEFNLPYNMIYKILKYIK